MMEIEIDKIYLMDCRQYLPLIPDKFINLIIIDPPYNELPIEWDNFGDWSFLKDQFNRILINNGHIYIFGKQPLLTNIYILFKDIFDFRFEMVWNKNRGLWSSDYMPMRSHELIWCFCKKGVNTSELNFDIEAVKIKGEPYVRKNMSKFEQRNNWQPRTIISDGMRFPLSVFNISPVVKRKKKSNPDKKLSHPTEKPLEIMEWIIKSSSKVNENVLDCFIGSGTTALACMKHNRHFLGCDNAKEYYEMSQEKISQKTLFQY